MYNHLMLACGINHKTAPLSIRERFSYTDAMLSGALQQCKQKLSVNEVAIVSTCNRTEFYLDLEDETKIQNWLCENHRLDAAWIQQYMYFYKDAASVRHLLHVACGLDSMLLGESQILSQLKKSYHCAKTAGTLGKKLQRLFQYAFAVTKQIRTQTAIGASPVSLAYFAVKMAKHIFADLANTTLLLVGAGEMIELVAKYFYDLNVKKILIANRTFAKAKQLAQKYQAQPYILTNIADSLVQADIVITAVDTELPLIGKGLIERALKIRKHKPMLVVDLAVPANTEPEVAYLEDVYRYTIDDMQQVIASHIKDRSNEAEEAKALIELHVEHYMNWQRSLNVVTTIQRFQQHLQQLQNDVYTQAWQELNYKKLPAATVLQNLSRNLINKLSHQPLIQLKQAAATGNVELIQSLLKLFALEED